MEDIFDCFYPYEVILFFYIHNKFNTTSKIFPLWELGGNYSQETI